MQKPKHDPPEPQPPATPTLDKLASMPVGMSRDLFVQIHRRAIARESKLIQDIENAAHVSAEESRVRWAERMGLTELATYWSKDPTSANIYRTIHSAQINRQLAEFEQAQSAAAGKPVAAPTTLSVLPNTSGPDDDGPQAA